MKNHALRRIAATAIIIILVFLALLGFGSEVFLRRSTADHCHDKAEQIKNIYTDLNEYIDLDQLSKDANSDPYITMRSMFKLLCESYDAKYICLFTVSGHELNYIMCAAKTQEDDDRVKNERKLGTKVRVEDTSFFEQALGGKLSGPRQLDNSYGYVYSYYFPVKDVNGKNAAVIGIDFDVTDMIKKADRSVITLVIQAAALLFSVLGLFLFVLLKKVFLPIKKISTAMNEFDPEKEHTPLKINSYQEIDEISESFNKMSGDIKGYISDLKAMADERARNSAELHIARRIQSGMVPEGMSIKAKNFDAEAFAVPAREVGGDFYDCFETDDRVYFVIADVSGKGVAAALFMAMSKNMIKQKLKGGLSPAEALNTSNDDLCAENPEGMFVTVFAAVLDKRTGELIYANAGHTPPLLHYGTDVRFIEPETGIALGLFEDSDITDGFLILRDGESITVYTDGITEAVSADKQLFGSQRLLDAAAASIDKQHTNDIVKAVKVFTEGCEQSDDMTMLTITYHSSEQHISEVLPAEMSSLGVVRDKLKSLADGSEKKLKIILAFEELFVNIIEYSGSETVGLILDRSENRLTIRLEDSGTEFDPLTSMPDEKEFEDYDSGGMGIRMAAKIASEIRHSYIDGKNILTMTFEL